jgi:hypothetical protein
MHCSNHACFIHCPGSLRTYTLHKVSKDDYMHAYAGPISDVKQTELGSTYSLYVPGGRMSLGAESVI